MSPVYDFKCPSCSGKIEQSRGFNEDTPAPMCGDCLVTLERVYSAPGVHFKGSGWGSSK